MNFQKCFYIQGEGVLLPPELSVVRPSNLGAGNKPPNLQGISKFEDLVPQKKILYQSHFCHLW